MKVVAGTERMALVMPALLRGQRVDFWNVEDWLPSRCGERPRGGYWLHRESGRLLAALDGRQSLDAVAGARHASRRLGLSLRDAREAEAGRALAWTSRLTPVPARIAEERIRRLALR